MRRLWYKSTHRAYDLGARGLWYTIFQNPRGLRYKFRGLIFSTPCTPFQHFMRIEIFERYHTVAFPRSASPQPPRRFEQRQHPSRQQAPTPRGAAAGTKGPRARQRRGGPPRPVTPSAPPGGGARDAGRGPDARSAPALRRQHPGKLPLPAPSGGSVQDGRKARRRLGPPPRRRAACGARKRRRRIIIRVWSAGAQAAATPAMQR